MPAAAIIGNLTFAMSSLEDFKAADESYDMVLGLSILHLVQNKEAIIAWVRTLLKPGGLFVTNTVCIGDANIFIRLMVPLGRMLGLVPLVKVLTTKKLVKTIAGAGFDIEHQWSPGKNKAVFIVARKTT